MRVPKVLSITCNNTSCNNVMIAELVNFIANFLGQPNQTCCFLHIINLVAKSIIWQFDVTKGKADSMLNEAEEVLWALAEGLDLEDLETLREQEGDDDKDDDGSDIDGWVGGRDTLSVADREALDVSIWPVKLVLVKVNGWVFISNVVTHLISTATQNHILNHTLHNTVVACMVPGTRTDKTSRTQNAS
jgi:hypothetical protein